VEAAAVGLRVEVDGPVARVTLANAARRNAQTPALWRALAAVPTDLPHDVRVVLMQAEGVSFSAGLDRRMFEAGGIEGEPTLTDLAAMSAEALDATIAEFQRGFAWLRADRFVSVAAVRGHAVGAGFQLALACDLRLVAEDARLCMREPSLGLVPDLGGTAPLVECLGYAAALELCVTGRWMDADEAVRRGLALRSVPVEDLPAAADELVAALSTAPVGAVRATKRLLRDAGTRDHEAQLAAERAEQSGRLAELAAWAGTAVGGNSEAGR
jgi:enoyl-CoA hydratase/carnithine racemase